MGDLSNSHDGHFGFCPANSQLYRGSENWSQGERGITHFDSWQIGGDRLIDGPRQEDGTDFTSYAAGASPDIAVHDCRHVVVAGHADHLGARAD